MASRSDTVSAMADTKSPTYRLAAEKVGKDTAEWINDQREAGHSWRWISLELYARHKLDVTEITIRRWWLDAQETETAEA